MTIEAVEYRSVIKFLVLRKTPSLRIIEMLEETYGSESPSKSTVQRWINEFKGGRQSVCDADKSGRPLEIDCSQKKEHLEKLIKEQRRITVKNLATSIHVSVGSCYALLQEMGVRKLCSRFVPKFLTSELQEKRRRACQENLEILEALGDSFLTNIVTEDETPLSLYTPESKRDSAEWKFPKEKPSLKLRAGTSHRRCLMLSVFWDVRGIVSIDFADSNTTLNSEYYSNLVKETRSRRRKPRNSNLWILHDNAPIHSAARVEETLEKCSFKKVTHPPYSPDLAPSDFYLFQHLKRHLRGTHFTNPEAVKEAVETFLKSKPDGWFRAAFDELVLRWKKCLANEGSYIEK